MCDPAPLPLNLKVTAPPSHPPLPSSPLPSRPLEPQPQPAMVWHCGIMASHGWPEHQHLSPFAAPYPLSLSPLSLRHRSSLIRGAGAGTDWWCGQGATGLWRLEMLGETVGWGAEQISAGARGDWTAACPRVIASFISMPCVCETDWVHMLGCTDCFKLYTCQGLCQ